MYRSKTDNNYYQEEQEAVLDSNLTEINENRASVGTILRQLGGVSAFAIAIVFLALAVKSDMDPISFSPVNKERQSEVFVQEEEQEEEKGSYFRFDPQEVLVLNGELFQVDLYYNFDEEKEISEQISFDKRNLRIKNIEFSEDVNGSYEENIRGIEINFDKKIKGEIKIARLVLEALEEGRIEISVGGETMEVNIVNPVIEVLQSASCSANTIFSLFGVEAKSGPGLGQVSLFWNGSSDKEMGIKYGTNPYVLNYEIESVGKVNSFIVSNLSMGQEYYFRIFDKNDCNKSINYREVKAKPGYGGMTQESIKEYEGILPVSENLIP